MTAYQVRCGGEWMERWGTVVVEEFSTIHRPPAEGWCGDLLASFTLGDVDPEFRPPFLDAGSPMEISAGGAVLWEGRITEYEPGRPIRVSGQGWGTRLEWVNIFDSDEGEPGDQWSSAIDADKALDAAIARGAGLLRYEQLMPTDPNQWPEQPEELPRTLGEVIGIVAQAQGKFVIVRGREVLLETPAAVTEWIWSPADAAVSRADDEWVSRLFAVALTYRPGSPHFELPGEAINRFYLAEDPDVVEHRERLVDLRKLGPIPEATAQELVDERFAAVKLRHAYTDRLSPHALEWRYINGSWADTDVLRAGDMIRIDGVLNDNDDLSFGMHADVRSRKVTHYGDGRSPLIEPVGFAPRDLPGALADAVEPEKPVS